MPAGGLEHRSKPIRGHRGDDAIEALAVEVHDPQNLAELSRHRVEQGLPDGTLIEFGVPDESDLTTANGNLKVARDIAMRQRAPDRRGRADADRAG